MTLLIPSILATSAAGPAHLGPATIQEMSPPIFLAAVTACLVLCSKFSPLCSATIKVEWFRAHCDSETDT